MQLLSPEPMLAVEAVPPESPRLQELFENPLFAVGLLLGWIVLRVLATWLASKAVMRSEMGTFVRALLAMAGHFVLIIALAVVLGVLMPIAARLQPQWRQFTVLGGVVLLFLIGVFKIPMKIYGIGFWRSFLLMFCAGALEGLAICGAQWAAGMPVLTPKQIASLQRQRPPLIERMVQQLSSSAKQEVRDEVDRLLDEAAALTGLPEREAAVRQLQKKLGERKLALPPGDTEAAANFERQLGRYMRLLNEVIAERNAAGIAR